ncbi:hypothetical protein BDZ97DRAFT_1901308 [Flammula alnicola]|nr:hypothetical protein BDZ97DRAFT_1901308 [Flammula alnicola]
MDVIQESDNQEELRVNFFPELFLQRRIWILNILRKENITKVLDVGCGEGQLLATLCRPAPWLTPPPSEILSPFSSPTSSNPNEPVPPSPTYNDDDVPNLHMREVHGLDISSEDLAFAVEGTAPVEEAVEAESPGYRSYTSGVQRWEDMLAKVWKGGLEVINNEFVDFECIVSTEVIEHLPSNIFPAFTPMLLGVYHPKFLLVTTPSYTFNARFTSPDAPKSARNGYPDPTGRTDRIFRHSDHKFEWTREEFTTWCEEAAKEWGYEVEETSIGRALNADPWGRDDELQGASSVATFRRLHIMDNKTREERGRAKIHELALAGQPHEALVVHEHHAHPASMKPRPLEEIAACVKAKMEEYREAFMRVEELWYEKEIAILCGGWIEMLVRAIEQSPDLNLKPDAEGIGRRSTNWSVELIGGVASPSQLWPAEGEMSVDYIPPDWTPGEGPYESWDDSDFGESTGAEGDVSADTSDADGDDESDGGTSVGWGKRPRGWKPLVNEEAGAKPKSGWAGIGSWGDHESAWDDVPQSSMSSAAGWDGDESGDTTT